ncbi:MAG: hypothetical protein WA395_06925 [Nitrososphaeraceae archaeon]|jgi:hypothetical protein
MPKRKVKEEKPPKRLGKKEILIAPIAMGASLLVVLVIIPHFAPPPIPSRICLKAHNVDSFNLYPTVQVVVNGSQEQLPNGVGKTQSAGKECLHVIHTDTAGNKLHIEYIRPIRLSMADFMKIYSPTNKTITVVDNHTGVPQDRVITLKDYNVKYSYYSEKGAFTNVSSASRVPPFTNELVARIQLSPK